MRTALSVRSTGTRDWLGLSVMTFVAVCLWTLLLAGRGAQAAELISPRIDPAPGADWVELSDALTPAVRAVRVHGAIDLALRQSTAPALRASGHTRDLGALEIDVLGDELHVDFKSGWRQRERLRLDLSLAALDRLSASGTVEVSAARLVGETLEMDLRGNSQISAAALTLDRLDLQTRGSTQLAVAGAAAELRLEASGRATIDAPALTTQVAALDIRGRGDVELAVAERLRVDIRGSGKVRYHGSPSVEQNIRGHGSVTQAPAPERLATRAAPVPEPAAR